LEGLQRAAQHRSRSTSGWGSQARIRGVQPGQPDHLPRPRRPRKHVVQTHPTTALFRRMRSYVVGWKLVSVHNILPRVITLVPHRYELRT